MIDYKLHIPGPVNVDPETFCDVTPVMGHRSKDFVDLYQSCQPNLQKLFQTDDPVFLSTSTWGAWKVGPQPFAEKCSAACAERFRTNGWTFRAVVEKKRMDYRSTGVGT